MLQVNATPLLRDYYKLFTQLLIHGPARQLLKHSMARHQSTSYEITVIEKDLTEDHPYISLTEKSSILHSLRDRFLVRMGHILHASASIQEDTVKHSVDIFLSCKDPRLYTSIEKELREVEHMLALIASHPPGTVTLLTISFLLTYN